MSQLNGTTVLVYADGTLVATQTDCTINVDQDLPSVTNKSSGGWAEHINGLKSGSISCSALYSTTGVSIDTFIANIIASTNILVMVDVGGTPMVCEGTPASVSIEAPTEAAATCSMEFTPTGGIYILTGASAQLLTGWTNADYDTFTTTGTLISSLIQDSGASSGYSNTIDLTDEDVVKVLTFVTLTSGELPSFVLSASAGGAAVSNAVQCKAGVSMMTLTVTATDSTSVLEISNTGAVNAAIGNTYVFKV